MRGKRTRQIHGRARKLTCKVTSKASKNTNASKARPPGSQLASQPVSSQPDRSGCQSLGLYVVLPRPQSFAQSVGACFSRHVPPFFQSMVSQRSLQAIPGQAKPSQTRPSQAKPSRRTVCFPAVLFLTVGSCEEVATRGHHLVPCILVHWLADRDNPSDLITVRYEQHHPDTRGGRACPCGL